MQKFIRTLTVTAVSCLPLLAIADDDGPRLTADASFIGGALETRQHIYYPGDSLDVRVSFTGDSQLLMSQGVDAYVAILDGNQTPTFIPVENYETFNSKRMFFLESVTTEVLPEGVYQLALVLTNPGGDPGNIGDWYNGFGGLLDSDTIQFSTNFLDADFDRDGEWDDDFDRDGFHGDKDDEYEFFAQNSVTDTASERDWDDDDWDHDDDPNRSDANDSNGVDSDSDASTGTSSNDTDSNTNDTDNG